MSLYSTTRRATRRGRQFQATVIDIHGSKASVRISETGAPVHNLDVIGGPIRIGQNVLIDYTTERPTIIATSSQGLTLSDVKNSVQTGLSIKPHGAGGGSGNSLFVPAIGGGYNVVSPLVYGGGPYTGGGGVEFGQAGLSFNQAYDTGGYQDYNWGLGIFTAPASSFHMYPFIYMPKLARAGTGDLGLLWWEAIEFSSSGGPEDGNYYAENEGMAYTPISRKFVPIEYEDIFAFNPGNVCMCYFEIYGSSYAGYLWFYGWQLEW